MPKAPVAPTLADVAKRAGVSTATVSRCLNEPAKVIEKTRNRVLAAVADLGYSPNFGARVMAAKRTRTIGAVIPTMENAIFARGLQAFQEELRAAGYTLLVASSSYDPAIEDAQIRTLVSRGADGLFLIGRDRSDAIYDFLAAQNVPALAAWTLDETKARHSIGFDNRRAMAGLCQTVLDQGHTHVAVITAPTADNDRARDRVAGIREALSQCTDPVTCDVIETPYSIDNGAAAFGALMTRSPRPTAVLCGNDVLAVGALRRAHELGIAVPGGVSITGFDNIELARAAMPALTTVDVPHATMGQQAARILLDMVAGKAAPMQVELETSVVLRQSLGPAPNGS